MVDNDIRRESPVTEDVLFLPEYFRQAGYDTMGIGKIFHRHAPDGVFDESGGGPRNFGPFPPEGLVWSGDAGKEGCRGTNTDWGAFPEIDSQMPPYLEEDLDDLPEIALAINDLPMMPSTAWAIESGEWPRIVQAYLACVAFVDFYVGELLKELEASRYADNTIVVLWSDHGYRLGEKHTFAKHCLWEEATNAPLIFSGPGLGKGKKVRLYYRSLNQLESFRMLEASPPNLTFTIPTSEISRQWDLTYYFEILNHSGGGWFQLVPAIATPYYVVEVVP